MAGLEIAGMQVLESKIRPPVLPEWVVARPRLLRRLTGPGARVAVLEAPAGYGKSVLAAQALAARRGPGAWVHFDRLDRDAQRACRHLGAALAGAFPPFGRTELEAQVEAPGFDGEKWMEDALLYLQRSLRTDCLLVLDNLESIEGATETEAALQRLVAHGPRTLQLLLTTRSRPRLGLSRLAESGEAVLLTAEQLAFNVEEFEEASRARQIVPHGAPVQEWWSRTGGWPVALGLELMRAATGNARNPRDYLEDEIFRDLPEDLRQFLLQTCCLEVVSEEAAAALAIPRERYADLVRGLASHGVPHLRLADGAIRIHPWIREMLGKSLQESGPEISAPIARRAAEHFRAEGRYDQFLQVLGEANLLEEALDQLFADWPRLYQLNLVSRLHLWLQPWNEAWRFHPSYAAAFVVSLRSAGRMRSLASYMEELRPRLRDFESSPHYARIWSGFVWSRVGSGQADTYAMAAEQWNRLQDRFDPATRSSNEVVLGVAALYELRFDDAERHFQAACEDAGSRPDGANALGVVAVERGMPLRALDLLEVGLSEAIESGQGDRMAYALLNLAATSRDLGRFREVLDTVERSDEAARRSQMGQLHTLPHVQYLRGQALWNLGRPFEAIAELERAREGFQESNRYEGLSAAATLDHYRTLVGRPSELVTDADFSQAPVCEARLRYLLRRARWHALRGERERVTERARLVREIGAAMPQMGAAAWFVEGWSAHRSGDLAAARTALCNGLEILGTLEMRTYPLADPVLTAWIVAQSTLHGRCQEVAQRLAESEAVVDLHDAFAEALAASEADPAAATRLLEAATRLGVRGLEDRPGLPAELRSKYVAAVAALDPAPLYARLLGESSFTVSGREVRFARKASRRVLLNLLLDHPNPVHEERLAETIWPEAVPERSLHRLQSAVNDLRQALDPHAPPTGSTLVPYRDEHYRLALPPGSFVDYHALRDRLTAALRPPQTRGPDPQSLRELEGILEAYPGELLADEPYLEEAAEPRERLRRGILECVIAILPPWIQAGQAEALPLLGRALTIDPLWAEGVLLQIDLLRRLGRPVAALRAYRDYEDRLERELGVAPDPEMRSLIERVVALE